MGLLTVLVCGLVASSAAAATVKVGQLFTPTYECGGFTATYLVTGTATGRSYVVPKAGIITSWAFEDGASPVKGLSLRVGRRAGGGEYQIVGQAAARTQKANVVNRYKAHIAVRAGDLIGIYRKGRGDCSTKTGNTKDATVYAFGDVSRGSTESFTSFPGYKWPLSVTLKTK